MSDRSHSVPHFLLRTLILAALYYIVGRLGLLMAIPPGYATVFWPASGIALGFVYHYGYRLLPGVWLGSAVLNIANYFQGFNATLLINAFVIGLGSAAQAGVATWLIRRYTHEYMKLERIGDIFRFISLGGFLSGVISASIGVTILLSTHTIPFNNAMFAWWTWYTGDVLGIITFGPLVVLILHQTITPKIKTIVSLPILFVFSIVIGIFYLSQQWHEQQLKNEFSRDSLMIHQQVQQTFSLYEQELESLHSFYNSSADVERDEFHTFIMPALKRNPGIWRITWLPYIKQEQREVFEKHVQSDGFPMFQFQEPDPSKPGEMKRAGKRDFYFPVYYVEPFKPDETKRLGIDLGFERTRLMAMHRAIETNKPTATERIKFFTDKNNNQYGVLLLIPVYKKDMPTDTVEQRWLALKGFVAASYRFSDAISPIIKPWQERGISIELNDVNDDTGGQDLLYNSVNNSSTLPNQNLSFAFKESYPLQEFNQGWSINIYKSQAYVLAHVNWAIWATLIGGIFFTALFGALMLVIAGRTSEIELIVTERTLALKKAQALAEEANQAKSDFLANMSHEIRTPMTGIIGMIRLMKDMNLSIQKRHYIETISYSADALLQIIDDILDFSKIEASKLVLESVPFDLYVLCKEVTELFIIRAWEKGIELRLDYDGMCPKYFAGDPVRIRQILFNLCGNAVKFTEKGRVILSVNAREANEQFTHIDMAVSDTGIGIPIEKQQAIFKKFDQVDSSTSRKYGGTGLGLSITQELVHMMGSQIKVESIIGHGARFFFDLVLPIADEADIPLIETPSKERLHYSGIKALLAEDNLVNQEVISTFLANRSIHVTTVSNGQEALSLLEKRKFDIVFMDCQMPVMDGYDATVALREKLQLHDLPVIAITAHAFVDEKQYCLDVGMNDYIAKPIQEAQFDAMLKKWLPEKSGQKKDVAALLPELPEDEFLLDYAVLAKLRSSTGDQFEMIIQMYLQEAEDLLQRIKNAIHIHDADAIEFSAHSLKTASGQIGALTLHEQMKMIEGFAGQKKMARMLDYFDKAQATFERVKKALQTNVIRQ